MEEFALNTTAKLPFVIEVSSVGFSPKKLELRQQNKM
jgi:hypothetical protein